MEVLTLAGSLREGNGKMLLNEDCRATQDKKRMKNQHGASKRKGNAKKKIN